MLNSDLTVTNRVGDDTSGLTNISRQNRDECDEEEELRGEETSPIEKA